MKIEIAFQHKDAATFVPPWLMDDPDKGREWVINLLAQKQITSTYIVIDPPKPGAVRIVLDDEA